MNESKRRIYTLSLTGGFALLGFLFRRWQWQAGRDVQGLWQTGSAPVISLLILSAAAVAFLAVVCSRLAVRPQYDRNFSGGVSAGIGYIVGGAGLMAANILGLLQQSGAHRIICLLGLFAGGVVIFHGILRASHKRPGLLDGCVVVVWLVARVIVDFKNWSTDPAVLDYCFQLLALLCSMLGGFHAAGFSVDTGKRRMTAFWSALAVFFCAAALADGGLYACLTYGAFLLLGLQNSWCVLGPDGLQQTVLNDAAG